MEWPGRMVYGSWSNNRWTRHQRCMAYMTTEPKFRVGDVVRLRSPHAAKIEARPSGLLLEPERLVPVSAEGVVQQCYSYPGGIASGGLRYHWCVVAIPEMRCYCNVSVDQLEFTEHQPSPEEIAAMYVEAAR